MDEILIKKQQGKLYYTYIYVFKKIKTNTYTLSLVGQAHSIIKESYLEEFILRNFFRNPKH